MEYSYRDELYHHGIKGQKWGVRRFQNSDGTWTAAGKQRYSSDDLRSMSKQVSEYHAGKLKNSQQMAKEKRRADDWYDQESKKLHNKKSKIALKEYDKAWDDLNKELINRHDKADIKQNEADKKLSDNLKKKYGIDVETSMREIQRNPIKTALAVAGQKKTKSIVSEHNNRVLDSIKSKAMDGDGLVSKPRRPKNVIN